MWFLSHDTALAHMLSSLDGFWPVTTDAPYSLIPDLAPCDLFPKINETEGVHVSEGGENSSSITGHSECAWRK